MRFIKHSLPPLAIGFGTAALSHAMGFCVTDWRHWAILLSCLICYLMGFFLGVFDE